MASAPAIDAKIDDRCRLCNEVKTDLHYIFDNPRLVENIRHHINLYIPDNDGLSKYVCDSCVDSLETIVKFVSNCHQIQRDLHRSKRRLPSRETPVHSCYMIQTSNMKEECSKEVTVDEDVNPADIKFTWTIPELSPATDGEPNASLTIKYQSEGWSRLLRLGDQRKKRLSKILHDRHKNKIVQERHITLTLSDIDEELTELEDPLLEDGDEPSANVGIGRKDISNGTVTSLPSVLNGAARTPQNP